jgi:hypothetical protein
VIRGSKRNGCFEDNIEDEEEDEEEWMLATLPGIEPGLPP